MKEGRILKSLAIFGQTTEVVNKIVNTQASNVKRVSPKKEVRIARRGITSKSNNVRIRNPRYMSTQLDTAAIQQMLETGNLKKGQKTSKQLILNYKRNK